MTTKIIEVSKEITNKLIPVNEISNNETAEQEHQQIAIGSNDDNSINADDDSNVKDSALINMTSRWKRPNRRLVRFFLERGADEEIQLNEQLKLWQQSNSITDDSIPLIVNNPNNNIIDNTETVVTDVKPGSNDGEKILPLGDQH